VMRWMLLSLTWPVSYSECMLSAILGSRFEWDICDYADYFLIISTTWKEEDLRDISCSVFFPCYTFPCYYFDCL